MKKLLNFRPFLFMAVSLIIGLITAYFYTFTSPIFAIVCIAIFLACIVIYLVYGIKNKEIKEKGIFAIIFCLFFILGGVNFSCSVNSFESANLDNHTLNVYGKITYVRQIDESQTKIILSKVEFSGYKNVKSPYKVQVYVDGDSNLKLGDLILFNSKVEDVTTIYDCKFSAENISNGVKYTANVNALDIANRGNILTIFERCNLFIKDSLEKGLKHDEFALSYAMLSGDSDYMDYGVLSRFRATGVAHIFAVSGLHIGFLAMALKLLFKKLKVNKYLSTAIIVFTLFFYAGVCGFSSSSLRASIMCAVLLISELFFARYDPLSSVSISATILLLISPMELFCVGFQLSFAVVVGIMTLSSGISKIFKFLPLKISNTLGTVFSAQLASIPISLASFGEVSVISVLANLIFIPIVSVIFIAIFICTIVGGIFGVSNITLFLVQYVLQAINFLINLIDYSVFMVGDIIMGVFAIGYYLALFIACQNVNVKKLTSIILSISIALVSIGGTIFLTVNDKNSSKIIVSGATNMCFSMVVEEKENSMVLSHYSSGSINGYKRVVNKEKIEKVDNLFLLENSVKDLQVLLTKLNEVKLPEKVYYYGTIEKEEELAITSSFKGIELISVVEESIKVNKFTFNYTLNGLALNIDGENFDVVILGQIPVDASTNIKVESSADLVVVKNRSDYILNNCNAINKLTYLKENGYTDAESNGYVKYVKNA